MQHLEEPMVTTSPHAKQPPSRRRRAVKIGIISVVVIAATLAVCLATSSNGSSSSTTSSNPTPAVTRPSFNGTVKIPPRRRSIIVLGDSGTQYGAKSQGWEVLLHEKYARSLDTFNRGLSAYNTRIYLQYAIPGLLEELANYYDPAVIIVWFGVNDANLEDGPNHAQSVPLEEYKLNLIEMVQQLRQAAPESKVLLLSPSYIDDKQRIAKLSDPTATPDRSDAATAIYAKACTEIYESTLKNDAGVGYLDVYDYFSSKYPSSEERSEMLSDGIHFSTKGNRVFYELVNDKIEDMVPSDVLTTWQFPAETEYITYCDGKGPC